MNGCYSLPSELELTWLRAHVIAKFSGMDYNTHHLDHLVRVASLALTIGREIGACLELLEAAAFLHDIARPDEYSEGCHAEMSAAYAQKLLMGRGWDRNLVDAIVYAVLVHRYRNGGIPRTLEAKILQDADRIDAIGAIGLARVLSHVPCTLLYNPISPSGFAVDDGTIVSHFQEKIILLKDGLNTEPAKKIAESRHALTEQFLTALKQEIVIAEQCRFSDVLAAIHQQFCTS